MTPPRFFLMPLHGVALSLAVAAILCACGGGGSGSPTPGGGNTTSTTPTTPPGANGVLSANAQPLANASVIFTCGCSGQAGTTTTDANGNFTLAATSTAIPSSPNPTYTLVPGRNYLVVGANTTTHQESWTFVFLGNTPPRDLSLSPSGSTLSTDAWSTAAALYVFYFSPNNSDQSFDAWNFNAMSAWTQAMRAGANAAEQKLAADITLSQQNDQSLFPTIPASGWDLDAAAGANPTIAVDLTNVKNSGDPLLPTPCPASACVGAPTP